MKILSIDTSSRVCSVAALEDEDVIIEKNIDNEKTHSQKLMPMVDSLLKACNLSVTDFNLFACCIGPGSFTGVRIGVATIKAFCDVTNIPICSVSSLEALAYNTLNSNFDNTSNLVCSIIDAKNDNIYYGLFEKKHEGFEQIEELSAKNIDDMINELKKYYTSPILFVGDGAEKHQYILTKYFKKATFVEDKYNIQSATSLGKAAFRKYQQGNYGDSNSLIPLYLRKSQAERAIQGEK